MNHPGQEEWMAYLYDETPDDDREFMEAHLQECDDCRERVAAWQGVMGELDRWELPVERKRVRGGLRLLAGALAALLLVALGLAAGLWAAPARLEPAEFRATVDRAVNEAVTGEVERVLQSELADSNARLRKELRARLVGDMRALAAESVAASEAVTVRIVGEFYDSLEQSRRRELRVIGSLLERLESRHMANYSGLREDLEKLAVLTRDELALTERQIRLIGTHYSPPPGGERPSDNPYSNLNYGRQDQ